MPSQTKSITADSFRSTLLKGAKLILADKHTFKGKSKEISGRKLTIK